MGQLRVMDRRGDTATLWDTNNATETDEARKRFDEVIAQGYMAYSVPAAGGTGTLVRTFDPEAERIVMSQRMQGG